jgi:hypothetical protein
VVGVFAKLRGHYCTVQNLETERLFKHFKLMCTETDIVFLLYDSFTFLYSKRPYLKIDVLLL